jgi:hypothetical protein
MAGLPIPGLPTLPPSAATPIIATIASEAISALLWQASQSPPAWGVFDTKNNQVVSPDSILEFSHRQDSNISNFPVQEGQFGSYNKVIQPFEIQLRFSKGGTLKDRTQFLQDIDALYQSIDLYTVHTPERSYQNVNLERYEVSRRGNRGAYFLTEVDLYFIQIIEVTAQYTTTAFAPPPLLAYNPAYYPNAQSPAAQPVSNVGSVQPQLPTSQMEQMGNAALNSLIPAHY